MSDAERGIYCSVIFFMLCNNGRIKNDLQKIKCLCNSDEFFEQRWTHVKFKFYTKGDYLRHRRVDVELRNARKRMQAAKVAGLKGAEKRWGSYSNPKVCSVTKEKERKESVIVKESKHNSNTNTNTISSLSSSSSSVQTRSLYFYEALRQIIIPRSQSDRTCFQNVTKWVLQECAGGRFNENIFDEILGYAKESKKARNPAACFMALLKKELGYERNTANAR